MTRPKQGGRVKTLSREGGKASPGKVDESNFCELGEGLLGKNEIDEINLCES